MGEPVEKELSDPRRVTRLIRLPELISRVGLGRSTIYRWMSEGNFPKAVSLGGRAVAWIASDIENWIKRKLLSAARLRRD